MKKFPLDEDIFDFLSLFFRLHLFSGVFGIYWEKSLLMSFRGKTINGKRKRMKIRKKK
jgi:hypothetical protein